MKVTSSEIKYALMWYLRFKRQWLCASECMDNDVMAITDKDIIEVEIKVSKYDLWKGEARKSKHKRMLEPSVGFRMYMPNRFYICIPIVLEEEAKLWVEQINKKYGIIRYSPELASGYAISIAKTAFTIKEEVNKNLEKTIMMRVCSENIGLMNRVLGGKKWVT